MKNNILILPGLLLVFLLAACSAPGSNSRVISITALNQTIWYHHNSTLGQYYVVSFRGSAPTYTVGVSQKPSLEAAIGEATANATSTTTFDPQKPDQILCNTTPKAIFRPTSHTQAQWESQAANSPIRTLTRYK